MSPPIIQYDYDFSPYSQKTRLLLAASALPYSSCKQPPVLPRPDLTSLGITYRRMPVLAIGRSVYCDTSSIIATIQDVAGKGAVPTSAADKAYEYFGNTLFWSVLRVVPGEILTEGFIKDRASIFPSLGRPDFASLRPSALGEFKAHLSIIEREFLTSQTPWIEGKPSISLADIHVVWVVRWVLKSLGVEKEAGFSAAEFPRVWRWIGSLPGESGKEIGGEEAGKAVLGSSDAKVVGTVSAEDPLGLSGGTRVSVESNDAEPGSDPQLGSLAGLGINSVVLKLDNGIQMHYPRTGYVVRKA